MIYGEIGEVNRREAFEHHQVRDHDVGSLAEHDRERRLAGLRECLWTVRSTSLALSAASRARGCSPSGSHRPGRHGPRGLRFAVAAEAAAPRVELARYRFGGGGACKHATLALPSHPGPGLTQRASDPLGYGLASLY